MTTVLDFAFDWLEGWLNLAEGNSSGIDCSISTFFSNYVKVLVKIA